MSLKLLSLSSMYPGSLNTFYRKNPDAKNLKYAEHLRSLLAESTEFAGSYNRNFIKLGINAVCVITNDDFLQDKWKSENKVGSDKKSDVLFEQVRAYAPDILWIEDLSFLTDDWFDNVRNQISSVGLIIAYHCSPFNSDILAKLRKCDFTITCTPGLKLILEQRGLKAFLVYHGFDKELLPRVNRNNADGLNNLTFSGSLITGGSFHSARIDLVENLIKEKIDLALYATLENNYKIKAKQFLFFTATLLKKFGLKRLVESIPVFEYGRTLVKSYSKTLLKLNRPPLYGIEMYNLFADSKIVLNIHIGVAGEYAGNMRMFEVTGAGSCLLTDNKKNITDLFEPGKEIVVYDSQEDCIRKVKWLLEHDKEREEIALAGQEKVLKIHTVEKRCALILKIIKSELLLSEKI